MLFAKLLGFVISVYSWVRDKCLFVSALFLQFAYLPILVYVVAVIQL